jgi:hypothetical protein
LPASNGDTLPGQTLTSTEAKRRLLEICEGDRDAAKAIWADRGDTQISVEDLDRLIAKAMP